MYKVNINFDEASAAWRANKITHNKSMFQYCCGVIKADGTPCKSKPYIWKRKNKHVMEMPGEWSPCGKHLNL